MTTALGDILLVLLSNRPATPFELCHRHAETLGDSIDIARVIPVLARQERLGHVRSRQSGQPGARRVCALTDAGERHQSEWMLELRADATVEDIRVRALLAMTATDPATFDVVLGSCLSTLELRRRPRRRGRSASAGTTHAAREAYDELITAATRNWLRDLRSTRGERDGGQPPLSARR